MGQIFESAESVAACIGTGNALGNEVAYLDKSISLSAPLRELDQAPSWSRLWIKQEFILVKGIHLYCGPDTLPWQDLERPIQDSEINLEKSYGQIEIVKLWRHRLARANRTAAVDETGSANLFSLLNKYGFAQCVDPRDKIYALLSLLPKHDMAVQQLKVNYAQSAFELFRQTLTLCFQGYTSKSTMNSDEYSRAHKIIEDQ